MFFFQVDNQNLVTNLENCYFYAMLITCKCMPFCKKLDHNTKSELLYLATTQWLLFNSNKLFSKGKNWKESVPIQDVSTWRW
jgi:hypothetical protein